MPHPRILVVDDHPIVLNATILTLRNAYPEADLISAQTTQEASDKVASLKPDLVVVDLSMPATVGAKNHAEAGLDLLKTLMQHNGSINIVVQSADPKPLVRLKPQISEHRGGFAIANKQLSTEEMLKRVELALHGATVTAGELQGRLELKSAWLDLLKFAFVEGLTDSAIAERMNVAERTVRHYWTKLQDALEVYPETGKNIRIQTEMRAREIGLLD